MFTLKRNPYYIGVDSAGNQLPYIDEVRFTYFADAQALNLAAIAGNFDMQERHINMTNYPVLKEQEKTGKYKITAWPTFGGADAVIALNPTYTADPEMGKLMADKDFRRALSLAINRDQIKESVFLGLGEARQGVPAPWHPYFPGPEWAQKYTEFKRDEANKMLDGIGLNKKDANGMRLLPSGKPATIEISVVPAFGAWPDVALLVSKDWEAVGIKTIVQIRERALHFKMNENNELMAEIWNEDTSAFPYTGNAKADPRNAPILTMGPLWRRWYATGGKEGAEPPPAGEAHRRDRRQGAHRRARGAGQAQPGALSHLGREAVRDRHDRAHAHGAGRGGDQHQVPQRALPRSATTGHCAARATRGLEQFYFTK